jgi:Variant SH3 domain
VPFAILPQVYGDQDADGFYLGECNGQRGLIPSNMVSMVEVDDPDIALQLLRDSCQPAFINGSMSSSRASSRTSGVTTHTVSTLSHQGESVVLLWSSFVLLCLHRKVRVISKCSDK